MNEPRRDASIPPLDLDRLDDLGARAAFLSDLQAAARQVGAFGFGSLSDLSSGH
jgi:hypothetical protein